MGNRGLKELICTTNGCELSGGNAGGLQRQGGMGMEGGNWENCNSIINKKYKINKCTCCVSNIRLYNT